MSKLKKKKTFTESLLEDKFIVGFLAIVLVISINHVVFNYMLAEHRTRTQAFDTSVPVFQQVPGTVIAGTNNVLLAEMWLPGAWLGNQNLSISYNLTGQSISLIDADGPATKGPGIDDDGAVTILDLDPNDIIVNAIFKPTDNVCADSLVPPVEDLYIDGTGDGSCVPGDGGFDYVLLDVSGDGYAAGSYYNVATSTQTLWGHSELVQNDGAYNYCGDVYSPGCFGNFTGTITYLDGADTNCNVTNTPDLSWDPQLEPAWDELSGLTTHFNPGIDNLYWDYNNCMSNCADGLCVGLSTPLFPAHLLYNNDAGFPVCPPLSGQAIPVAGDTVWQPGEFVLNDLPSNDFIAAPPDGLVYDQGCLTTGYIGSAMSPMLPGEPYSESIWLVDFHADTVIFQGDQWNNNFPNQWQGDAVGTWIPCGTANGACYYENSPNGYVDSTDTLIIDVNGNGDYDPGLGDYIVDIGLSFNPIPPPATTLNDLSSAVGVNGFNIIFADVNPDGGPLSIDDTLLEDDGTVQGGTNNGLIDRWDHVTNRLTLTNLGSAVPGRDITNLKMYMDFGAQGFNTLPPVQPFNGSCDNPPGSIDDLPVNFFGALTPFDSFTYNASEGQWISDFSDLKFTGLYPAFVKVCIAGDVPATAVSSTLKLNIPQLNDTVDPNGLYDPGEAGFFFSSNNDGTWAGQLTAPQIQITGFTGNPGSPKANPAPPVPATPIGISPEGPPLPPGLAIGDTVKLADVTTVFLITDDGKKSPFPTQDVFLTYYPDFSKVKTVSQSVLQQLPLGPNIQVRAGTALVKSNTTERIYIVEPEKIIRWIENSTLAEEMFGADWEDRILILPDVFISEYSFGDNITTVVYTTGVLIQYQGSSEIYYLEEGNKRLVSPEVFAKNSFMDKYIVKNLDPTEYVYTTGDPFPELSDFFHITLIDKTVGKMFLHR